MNTSNSPQNSGTSWLILSFTIYLPSTGISYSPGYQHISYNLASVTSSHWLCDLAYRKIIFAPDCDWYRCDIDYSDCLCNYVKLKERNASGMTTYAYLFKCFLHAQENRVYLGPPFFRSLPAFFSFLQSFDRHVPRPFNENSINIAISSKLLRIYI